MTTDPEGMSFAPLVPLYQVSFAGRILAGGHVQLVIEGDPVAIQGMPLEVLGGAIAHALKQAKEKSDAG